MTAIDVGEEETMVDEIHHVDRGYGSIEEKPAQPGARVRGGPA